MDINLVNQTAKVTYEQATSMLHSTPFLIVIGILWFLPLLLYLLIGAVRGAKTSSGSRTGKRMIQTSGFWITWAYWFFFQGFLILALLLFPFWLKL
jgi:hypothetical protein